MSFSCIIYPTCSSLLPTPKESHDGFAEFLRSVYSKLEEYFTISKFNEQRISIISFIGNLNEEMINKIVDQPCFSESSPTQVFTLDPQFKESDPEGFINSCEIQLFYDQKSTVYLFLKSLHHERTLNESLQYVENLSKKDFQEWFSNKQADYLKALLFIFSVSHVVIAGNSSVTLDVSYIRMFRFLQLIKREISKPLESFLKSIYQWYNNHHQNQNVPWFDIKLLQSSPCYPGRCIPILAFLFQYPPSKSLDSSLSDKNSKNYIQLEQGVENQIKKLIKATRFLNKDSSKLFDFESKNLVFFAPQPITHSQSFHFLLSNSLRIRPESIDSKTKDGYSSLKDFLKDQLFSLSRAETPSGKEWLFSCLMIQELFIFARDFKRNDTEKILEIVDLRTESFDPEALYSEGWCQQALEMAKEHYVKDLPSFYTEKEHEEKLLSALKVYNANKTGSFSDFYEVKTRESCTSIWKKGRRKCEAESLTGHPCYSKFHERDNSIQHSNNFKSTHTCSCGHAKKVRDDPFTLKAANCDFYQSFSCQEQGNFTPFSIPPIIDPDDSNSYFPMWSIGKIGRFASSNFRQIAQEGFLPNSNFLVQWTIPVQTLSVEERSKKIENDFYHPVEDLNSSSLIQDISNIFTAIEKVKKRVSENDVQLPLGQIQTSASSDKSPEKDKRNRSKGKYRQRKNLFDQYETVALYIGVEYECQLGHRFLFSGKNPKHSKTYKQQESEQSFILSNDLPLITQCPSCNLNVPQNSGYMMKFAQLMRIFIVTPDSPSLITFAPKVQLLSTKKETSNEASSSQIEIIFDSGFEKGIVLPKNTTIVARLPYIYYSKGKYYHPQTSQLVLSKHFLYYNPVTEQQQSLPQQKIE